MDKVTPNHVQTPDGRRCYRLTPCRLDSQLPYLPDTSDYNSKGYSYLKYL